MSTLLLAADRHDPVLVAPLSEATTALTNALDVEMGSVLTGIVPYLFPLLVARFTDYSIRALQHDVK